MKWQKYLVFIFVCMLCLFSDVYAETDSRILTRVPEIYEQPKTVSIFLKFNGPGATNISNAPHGIKTRSYIKIWDELYLQIYSQGHAKVKEGIWGYFFSFSNDETGKDKLLPIDQPSHGMRADGIAASHFRNEDNSGPYKDLENAGPNKLEYRNFLVKIRVLEFEILNAEVGKVPSFKSLSCLVTIMEKQN